MSIFDIIAILLIIYFAVNGYKKGFVYELLGLAAIVIAIYLANTYYIFIAQPIKQKLAGAFNLNITALDTISSGIAYLVVILAVLLLFKFLVIPLVRLVFRLILTRGLDSALGVVFGFLKGIGIAVIFLVLMKMVYPSFNSYLYDAYASQIGVKFNTLR